MGHCVHTSIHQPHFAPPASQLWGEFTTFLSSKSPRIGGFRGRGQVKENTKDSYVNFRSMGHDREQKHSTTYFRETIPKKLGEPH
jgi:hypothetical protein